MKPSSSSSSSSSYQHPPLSGGSAATAVLGYGGGGLDIGVTPSPPSVLLTEAERARRQRRRQRRRPCSGLLAAALVCCRGGHTTRSPEERAALVGFVGLVGLATAGERVAFKVAIDQMEPFRVFLALLVNLALVLASAALVLHARLWAKPHPSQPQAITPAMHRFPRRSVLLIAALDAMQLAVMVVAGASTPPVLTVLFMQATLPFSLLLSALLARGGATSFPRRIYLPGHWHGAGLILLGIAVAMAPTVHAAFWEGQRDIGINTLAYVLCCLPAALSQLAKERAITHFGQPMNIFYLNFLLGLYQFLLLLLLSPLAYRLQGLGQGWDAYAKTDVGTAMADLGVCLFTGRRIDPVKYPIAPECSYASFATGGYVLFTLLVTYAANGLLERPGGSPALLYHTLNAAVALAFVVLAAYSFDKFGLFSYALNPFDFLGLLLVLGGLELYHRQPEPDMEILTTFSPPRDQLLI